MLLPRMLETISTVTGEKSVGENDGTVDGVKYRPHSMMHKAILCMDPMKLEMLNGFEQIQVGHKFTPEGSDVHVTVTGRDWDKKRVLLYGCKSSEKAQEYVEMIIKRVTAVDHDAELIDGPEITNIAVSGDLGKPLTLESMSVELREKGINIEYEPEQFPAAMVRLDQPAVTVMLFSTGRFVIQGLRAFDDIEPVIKRVQSIIK